MKKLSKYDFVIHFCSGIQGGKPDALSHRPDYARRAKICEPTPFFKPSQVDISKVGVEVANGELGEHVNLVIDRELEEAIREALPKDPVAA